MSAVTVAGCGTQPQMSAKVSPRLLLWLSVSPTARVSCIRLEGMGAMLTCTRCQPVQGCLREGSAGEREGHFSVESQYSDSCLKRKKYNDWMFPDHHFSCAPSRKSSAWFAAYPLPSHHTYYYVPRSLFPSLYSNPPYPLPYPCETADMSIVVSSRI